MLLSFRYGREVFVCEVGYFPSLYLGLPLGNNSRAMSFWGLVCEKVRKRLTEWKKGFFSKVGRLTMIRSVMSRIPVYYVSLFKMPSSVCKSMALEGVDKSHGYHLLS